MSHPSPYDRYEVVIGLEVHCQLLTQTKIFSAAPTRFGAAPNSQVMHVDLGLPGALPVLNRRAVELAVIAGLATSCRINPVSQFARKNYFYPDLPKGYQISQHTLPLCSEGWLDVPLEGGEEVRRVRIERIHMEEDAGKSSHLASTPHSVIDLNRAGVPLIEIVSFPDMRSADEAVAYLKALHQLVVYLGVCDGNMEEGSFRCDANVSVRLHGEEALGTRCELKNINSFKFVRDAILFETRRQIDRIEAGHTITQQTRLYNPERGETIPMRDKEEAHDYRYFPEPDLPPLVLDEAWLTAQREALPELPAQRRERYQRDLNLSLYDAQVLTAQRALSEYFEAALAHFDKNPKLLTNWICNELLAVMGTGDTFDPPIAAEQMAALVALIDKDVISGKIAKQVFSEMLQSGRSPAQIVEEKGLRQITDPAALTPLIEAVLRDNPLQVQEYRDGKTSLLAFFVGQVMKASRGKANPALVNELLTAHLDDPSR